MYCGFWASTCVIFQWPQNYLNLKSAIWLLWKMTIFFELWRVDLGPFGNNLFIFDCFRTVIDYTVFKKKKKSTLMAGRLWLTWPIYFSPSPFGHAWLESYLPKLKSSLPRAISQAICRPLIYHIKIQTLQWYIMMQYTRQSQTTRPKTTWTQFSSSKTKCIHFFLQRNYVVCRTGKMEFGKLLPRKFGTVWFSSK